MSDTLELPFDQYQRYELVHALLESVRTDGETFRVLDVGGRTALLREFLPDDRVDLVDIDPSDAEGLILGSGAQLPFADDSFDVVAGFDTLEHVPPDLRDAFVAECARVAKRYVMLAGPYHTDRVAEAEDLLLDFLKTRLEWEHRYLAEHRSNGLPDAARTTQLLEQAGAEVETFGHGALDRWLLLMSLELYVEHEPLLAGIAKRVYRLYNEHLFSTDHGPEVYRHAIVGVFGGAKVPTLDGVLVPQSEAPRDVIEALRGVGQEVMRYDALRDSFQPEMERLHGVVKSLEDDLAQHKQTLRTVTEDRDASKASVETVSVDLVETKKSLETVQLDLVETKKSFDTLQSDLVESKKTIEALRAEQTRERGEVANVMADKDAMLGGLTGDLDGHRALVLELRSLHEAAAAEVEVRGAELERLRAVEASTVKTINELNERLSRQDAELRSVHDQLHGALARATELRSVERARTEEFQQLERGARQGIASALSSAEDRQMREQVLDAQDLSLADEIALLVDARDRRLRERDEARDQLLVMAAELVQERSKRETLVSEVSGVWSRVGRFFSRKKLDQRLVDE